MNLKQQLEKLLSDYDNAIVQKNYEWTQRIMQTQGDQKANEEFGRILDHNLRRLTEQFVEDVRKLSNP